jgi:immune inhibitor A
MFKSNVHTDRDEYRTGMMRVIILPIVVATVLLLAVSIALAMPPHPGVAEKIASGQISAPEFMKEDSPDRPNGLNTGGAPILRKAGILARPGVTGNFKILTVIVDFSDNPASVPAADFDTLIYADVNGTVHNYYKEVSYSTLSLTSPSLPSAIGWVRAPQTYAYYVDNNYGLGSYPHNTRKLVEDIVDAIDDSVDFLQFDNDGNGYVDGLIVVHAGPGAEFTGSPNDIWSHKWGISPREKDGVYISTYSMNPEYWSTPGDITIGVYCHELGHVFGLPDLYDTDGSSFGIDDWSVMAGGSWNGPSYMGGSPAHPDAWSRIFLGFVTPTVQAYDDTGINIPRVETNATIYKLWTDGSPTNEYFLVENRQKTGYDSYIPGDGLLVWHIDDDKSGNTDEWWPGSGNPSHYKVALVQADNLWELEKQIGYADHADPFPGSTDNRNFSGATSPNSNSYSGTGTSVSIVNISNSGANMTADVTVGTPQGITSYDDLLPGRIRLLGNVPNPFNPVTAIAFEVFEESPVKLEVFNITGQRVKILSDDIFREGTYLIRWDGKDDKGHEVGSGVYFYRVSSGGRSVSKKMLKLS